MTTPLINYEGILNACSTADLGETIRDFSEQLPHEWGDAYKVMSPHKANILRIERDGFEYLFDFSSELVLKGEVRSDRAVEDRLVAVHGCSHVSREDRRDSLMRKHPLGPVEFIRAHSTNVSRTQALYDKGHFIGHALGGLLHINLFPQSKTINRGWSEAGKLYRKMERYCQKHPGTYCFSRPIYLGYSGHPHIIEFGVLKTDRMLWVHQFPNCDSPDEMVKIEQLFRAKIAGQSDEELQSILGLLQNQPGN
jgi:hypothetical protein